MNSDDNKCFGYYRWKISIFIRPIGIIALRNTKVFSVNTFKVMLDQIMQVRSHINVVIYYGGRLLCSEVRLSFIFYGQKISVCPFQKQSNKCKKNCFCFYLVNVTKDSSTVFSKKYIKFKNETFLSVSVCVPQAIPTPRLRTPDLDTRIVNNYSF